MLSIYYSQFKQVLYENIFTSIVYGEGQETPLSAKISKPWRPAYDHRCISRSIRCLGLRLPVSCHFEGRTVQTYSKWHFRRRPGLRFSRPRMIMFGITTFIFVLGIIALVLVIIFQLQATLLVFEQDSTNPSLVISFRGTSTAWATVTRLMVRPNDAFM